MAATLVARKSKTVIRSISDMKLRVRSLQIRAMSSNDSKPISKDQVYHESGDQDAKRVWPDTALSFDPYHQMRFPLPGGCAATPLSPPLLPVPAVSGDLLHSTTRYQQQAEVLNQLNQPVMPEVPADSRALMDVELKVQDCPLLMRKDFQLLFPGTNVMLGEFTVVSLCQRTVNDMSGWSEEVEEERESLIKLYSETARELCNVLRNNGYWADFIDPCSGKPFLGPHTTDTMFETDERYRHFGFDIEDLGCCKVIKHHKWGAKSFVGCIFTNAPADAPILVELTQFTQSKVATETVD